jgi:hypothetical protein
LNAASFGCEFYLIALVSVDLSFMSTHWRGDTDRCSTRLHAGVWSMGNSLVALTRHSCMTIVMKELVFGVLLPRTHSLHVL